MKNSLRNSSIAIAICVAAVTTVFISCNRDKEESKVVENTGVKQPVRTGQNCTASQKGESCSGGGYCYQVRNTSTGAITYECFQDQVTPPGSDDIVPFGFDLSDDNNHLNFTTATIDKSVNGSSYTSYETGITSHDDGLIMRYDPTGPFDFAANNISYKLTLYDNGGSIIGTFTNDF